jgi:hypothetical protein
MKNLLVILFAAGMLVSCGDGAKNSAGANTDENIEDNSGEIATPQLEDSVGGMDVDTLSAPMQTDSIR